MKNQLYNIIKKVASHIGLPCVYVGVAVLFISYLFRLSNHNWILFTGLALIILGIIGYTVNDKHQSKY